MFSNNRMSFSISNTYAKFIISSFKNIHMSKQEATHRGCTSPTQFFWSLWSSWICIWVAFKLTLARLFYIKDTFISAKQAREQDSETQLQRRGYRHFLYSPSIFTGIKVVEQTYIIINIRIIFDEYYCIHFPLENRTSYVCNSSLSM